MPSLMSERSGPRPPWDNQAQSYGAQHRGLAAGRTQGVSLGVSDEEECIDSFHRPVSVGSSSREPALVWRWVWVARWMPMMTTTSPRGGRL